MKGKAKSADIKLVTGNPGKREIHETPKPKGLVEKPDSVLANKKAIEVWDRYAPELERLGLLTSIDAPMFGIYCRMLVKYENAPNKIKAAEVSQMRQLASNFGMDPTSRQRLIADSGKGKNKKDPAEEFFDD